jgi:hypothetical protein
MQRTRRAEVGRTVEHMIELVRELAGDVRERE